MSRDYQINFLKQLMAQVRKVESLIASASMVLDFIFILNVAKLFLQYSVSILLADFNWNLSDTGDYLGFEQLQFVYVRPLY